jgi:hypothetical protein
MSRFPNVTALAAAIALAGMLLPSAALGQKAQFVRSKPHVNVGALPAGASNHLLAPNVLLPDAAPATTGAPLVAGPTEPMSPGRR